MIPSTLFLSSCVKINGNETSPIIDLSVFSRSLFVHLESDIEVRWGLAEKFKLNNFKKSNDTDDHLKSGSGAITQ